MQTRRPTADVTKDVNHLARLIRRGLEQGYDHAPAATAFQAYAFGEIGFLTRGQIARAATLAQPFPATADAYLDLSGDDGGDFGGYGTRDLFPTC